MGYTDLTSDYKTSLPKSVSFDHLIIVCCHGIWLGGPSNGHDEAEWAIEPFQQGEIPTFIEHIKEGLRDLSDDPRALLVFSGGATKPRRTQLTEAESYLSLARSNGYLSLLPATHTANPAIITEPYATSSYQNLLFSLLKFVHAASHPPSHITLITHAFKARRFLESHCRAIRWEVSRMRVVGIDPPIGNGEEGKRKEEAIMKGEESAIRAWEEDLYGVGLGERGLGRKSEQRGWKEETEKVVGEGWESGIKGLLEWRGGESGREVYRGHLPWDRMSDLVGET